MGGNLLTGPDYRRLAKIVTGPHGEFVTIDNPVDVLLVFSCADPAVGVAAADLHRDGIVRGIVFSGGVGKDSGGLSKLGIAEATFLASVAISRGLPADAVILEREATNGKENAEFGLRIASERGLLSREGRAASLAPALRSRRLYEELRYRALASYPHVGVVAGFSSGAFDADDQVSREELVRELRGLHSMHAGPFPRILLQEEFQAGGNCFDPSAAGRSRRLIA